MQSNLGASIVARLGTEMACLAIPLARTHLIHVARRHVQDCSLALFMASLIVVLVPL
jgi:hypothetical protein